MKMTTRAGAWRMAVRRACVAAAIALAAAHACAQSPWGADYFPNVTLTTQDGATVRFWDDLLKDKSVVINLFYTSCTNVCPLETAKLVQVQQRFGARMGRDIYFYSIAIDPWDTPAEMKAYAGKFHVGPGWLFLAGKAEDVQLIARKLGLRRATDAQNPDGHAASLMIGNVPAGLWMRQSGTDNPQFLATQIGNFLGWPPDQPGADYAAARPLDISRAQAVFQSRCAACHTIGRGDRVGPDLQGVTLRRERAWLTRFIAESDRMRTEGDPLALDLYQRYNRVPMPNLGLGEEDVAALLDYLRERTQAGLAADVTQMPKAPPQPPVSTPSR